jgi:hypothetical protein
LNSLNYLLFSRHPHSHKLLPLCSSGLFGTLDRKELLRILLGASCASGLPVFHPKPSREARAS